MNDNDIIYSKKTRSKFPLNMSSNSKKLREYKMTLNSLSKEQWEISIGLMLGDASLQTQNNGKTYRMKSEWGNKNKKYAEHVHSLFNEWILSPPHKKSRVNVNGNVVVTWGFQTLSHKAFNPLSDLFLIKKCKGIIDNLIKKHLTVKGLAYWFMNDWGKLDYNKNQKRKA